MFPIQREIIENFKKILQRLFAHTQKKNKTKNRGVPKNNFVKAAFEFIRLNIISSKK